MKCPYCNSEENVVIVEMRMPGHISAYTKEQIERISIFPLEVRLCMDCLLGFNSKPLTDRQLSEIYENYVYIKPNSGIGISKYDGMKKTLLENLNKNDYIVEIGSSDGYLLAFLYDHGFQYLEGIEPSPVEFEEKYPIRIRKDFFSPDLTFEKPVDAFILMHVLEHFPSPEEIFTVMKEKLQTDGKVIFEVPNFCGFHHQHLLYFNRFFLSRFFSEHSYTVLTMNEEKDSLRCVVKAENKGSCASKEKMNFSELYRTEIDQFIAHSLSIVEKNRKQAERLNDFISENRDRKIIWWGSGSTSVIAINQIHPEILSSLDITIVDSDPSRAGLFLPGCSREIRNANNFLQGKSIEVLVIGSSFVEEIKLKVRQLGCSPDKVFNIEYL